MPEIIFGTSLQSDMLTNRSTVISRKKKKRIQLKERGKQTYGIFLKVNLNIVILSIGFQRLVPLRIFLLSQLYTESFGLFNNSLSLFDSELPSSNCLLLLQQPIICYSFGDILAIFHFKIHGQNKAIHTHTHTHTHTYIYIYIYIYIYTS